MFSPKDVHVLRKTSTCFGDEQARNFQNKCDFENFDVFFLQKLGGYFENL